MKNFLVNIWQFGKYNNKIIVNLYIPQSWKKIQHKRKLSMFLYTSNTVWFSLQKRWKLLPECVFANIYSKLFLAKYNKFWFLGFWKFFLNHKKIFKLGLESSGPWNIRNFLRVGFFYFSSSESYFLKQKKFFGVSISWYIKKVLR